MTLRGKHIVLDDFDANIMADCIDETKLDYEDGKKYPETEKTDKFSHIKWVAWEDMVYTYFTATKKKLRSTPHICHTQDPRSTRNCHR